MHQKSIITKLFHHKLLHAWRLASQILVISTICEGRSPWSESPCEISMMWRKMNANLCLPHLGTHWGMNAKLMNSDLAWETNYHLYFYLNLALDWKTLFLNFLYAAEQHRKYFIKSCNLKNIFLSKQGQSRTSTYSLGKYRSCSFSSLSIPLPRSIQNIPSAQLFSLGFSGEDAISAGNILLVEEADSMDTTPFQDTCHPLLQLHHTPGEFLIPLSPKKF